MFDTSQVKGEVLFYQRKNGVVLKSLFTKLPPGKHGYHIHRAGDLRGEGSQLACDSSPRRALSATACSGCCDHWHKGPLTHHGGPPSSTETRHTGDLGNIELVAGKPLELEQFLRGVTVDELYGRSLIVHADEDDYGKGGHEDSKTTGHSGKRIACSLIGRTAESCQAKTRKKNSSQ